MPTYDFQCTNCNDTYEETIPISELDKVTVFCPKCKTACKRIISGGSGFLLKGDGWASDGYSDPIKNKGDKE